MKKPTRLGKDNEFLETPKKKQKIKEKEQLSMNIKTKYIQDLQESNRKLKYQIIKINELLEEQKDRPVEKKEHKLIQESSEGALKQQLQIAYKQIKGYEKQIKTIQVRQTGGLVQKMTRLESILKEKSDYLQKVKNESVSISKHSMANVRKLKNNAGKEEMENAIIKNSEQIKRLRERIKDLEVKSKKKKENAKKQYDYVKRLQKDLLEEGVAFEEIEELKEKKKQYLNEVLSKSKNEEEDKEEQNRMKEFNEMKNEIKLLKKLHSEYDRKLQDLEEVKKQQEQEMIRLSQKVQQKNEEIQQIQDQIEEYRVKINKVNIKPTYSYSKPEKKQKKQKPQMLPSIIKKTETQKSIQQILPIKYDEKGNGTEKGKRFTDRSLFGKSTNIRIIGVKVWTEKRTFAINGIQCIYKFGDQRKDGQEHINKEGKKFCSENTIDIDEGDYIRLVSGHISENNVVEYLVFITKNKMVGRFGMAKAKEQKQFNFNIQEDEVPICMFGSILKTKDPKTKREGSILQSIGFEICKDKSFKKEDKLRI